ncbi:uncharacterized protein LOC129269743 [Lytechinus pictus]|uniref:uncharacterized protein LOC129269743 n=1 Tax=Lytechinus pictus TaxID=7653 RepID=UPI0030B9FCC2
METHFTLHDERSHLLEHDLYDSFFMDQSRTWHPQSIKQRPKSGPGDRFPLPLVTQVTLGFLGLWSPHRKTESPTAISSHSAWGEDTLSDNNCGIQQGDDKDDSSKQYVDRNDSRYSYDRDGDGGDRSRKTLTFDRKKRLIAVNIGAFSYLILCCSLMAYNFISYMKFYWGKKEDVLHLVSYFTYLFEVMVIPFWCFYARILYLVLGHRYREYYPLSPAYLSNRVAVLKDSRFGAKCLSWFRLIFFLVWPLTNVSLRFVNDYYFKSCRTLTTYKETTHWCAFFGYIFYGSFCYLVYIERRSFECEVHQIATFAREQAAGNNVDLVRGRISQFYKNYNVLRRLIGAWMAFSIVVATWGITAHIIWNYLIFSDSNIDPQNIPMLNFLNVLIGSQKIMFFVVPFYAIGGLNLEHVWKRLKYEIVKCRQYDYDEYWTAINRYIYEINVDYSGDLTPTLIFSAIGFYLGHIGKDFQEHTRWNYPMTDCLNGTRYK